MSTQIVQFPRQAGRGPVERLARAVEQPVQAARQVQQLRFTAGQVQFKAAYLQQHVKAGTATEDMVSSVRAGLWRIEQRLEELVDVLGAQHVELDELAEELTALVDAVLDRHEDGDVFGGTTAGKARSFEDLVGRWSA